MNNININPEVKESINYVADDLNNAYDTLKENKTKVFNFIKKAILIPIGIGIGLFCLYNGTGIMMSIFR